MYFAFALVLLGCLGAATSEGWDDSFLNRSSLVPLFHFKQKSYYFGRFQATYLEADHFCKMIHMELVRIESSEENQKLSQFLQQSDDGSLRFWTAGSKLVDTQTWVWMTTGEVIKYFNWINGQPDHPTTELCLELMINQKSERSFNDLSCQDKIKFICERNKKGPQLRDNTTPIPIDPNLNERNYRIFKIQQTMQMASQSCKQYGMELVSIQDKQENDFLTRLIAESGNVGHQDFYWTSGMIHYDQKWRWWNNEQLNYTNWLNGKPNHNSGSNQICMHLYTNGLWNDIGCYNSYYFICERLSPMARN